MRGIEQGTPETHRSIAEDRGEIYAALSSAVDRLMQLGYHPLDIRLCLRTILNQWPVDNQGEESAQSAEVNSGSSLDVRELPPDDGELCASQIKVESLGPVVDIYRLPSGSYCYVPVKFNDNLERIN